MERLFNYFRIHIVKMYQTSVTNDKLHFTKKKQFLSKINKIAESKNYSVLHIVCLLSIMLLHDVHHNHKRKSKYPIRLRKHGKIVFDMKNFNVAFDKIVANYSEFKIIDRRDEKTKLQAMKTLHAEGVLSEFSMRPRLKKSLEKHKKYHVVINKKSIKPMWLWIR